jgi:hypothetical protein
MNPEHLIELVNDLWFIEIVTFFILIFILACILGRALKKEREYLEEYERQMREKNKWEGI